MEDRMAFRPFPIPEGFMFNPDEAIDEHNLPGLLAKYRQLLEELKNERNLRRSLERILAGREARPND